MVGWILHKQVVQWGNHDIVMIMTNKLGVLRRKEAEGCHDSNCRGRSFARGSKKLSWGVTLSWDWRQRGKAWERNFEVEGTAKKKKFWEGELMGMLKGKQEGASRWKNVCIVWGLLTTGWGVLRCILAWWGALTGLQAGRKSPKHASHSFWQWGGLEAVGYELKLEPSLHAAVVLQAGDDGERSGQTGRYSGGGDDKDGPAWDLDRREGKGEIKDGSWGFRLSNWVDEVAFTEMGRLKVEQVWGKTDGQKSLLMVKRRERL